MNIAGIFHPVSLLIWVPGLLFFLCVLRVLTLSPRGEASRGLYFTTLALFLVSLLSLFVIPGMQIQQAITYANAYEPDSPVSSYQEISYDAKASWFRTALPVEEREERKAIDDIFNFDAPAGEAAEAVRDLETLDSLEYRPEYSSAWLFLVFFMIPGMLGVLQGPKRFCAGWKQSAP